MAGKLGDTTVLKPTSNSKYDGIKLDDAAKVAKITDLRSFYIQPNGEVHKEGGEPITLVPGAPGQDGGSYGTPGQATAAFLKRYQGAAGQAKLKALLLSKKAITAKEANSSNWGTVGVYRLLSKFTQDSVYAAQTGIAPQDGYEFDAWLGSSTSMFASGSGSESRAGASSREDISLTDKPDARTDINAFMVDSIGSGATKEEVAEYTEALAKLEKSSKQKTTTTTDSKGRVIKATGMGAFVTEDEKIALQTSILKKRLRSTDAATILKSAKGSKVALDIATLREWASIYGVSMSEDKALSYVTAGFGTKDYVDKQVEKIKAVAMQMYPTLKDHLAGGGTVRDIAEQYGSRKAKKLGIAMGEPTQDKDVMNAVTKGTSVGDFDIEMQKRPEWRLTQEANEIGIDFSETILKSFGLMG